MKDIILKHEALKDGELKYKHLLGRPFVLGKTDCYDIARCMFRDNLGIELTNYARPKFFWHNDDMNIYVDNYYNEGFRLLDDVRVEDLRPFDCFLIAIPDPRSLNKTVTNHCVVYLGEGMVIQHRYGTFSSIERYKGSLRNLTTHTIRHKDVPDLRAADVGTADLMNFILPHKREELLGAQNDKPVVN